MNRAALKTSKMKLIHCTKLLQGTENEKLKTVCFACISTWLCHDVIYRWQKSQLFFFFFLVHHLRCLKPNFQHLSYFHVSGIQGTQSLLGSPRNNAFDLSTTSVKVSVHSIAFIGLRHERPVTSCRKMRERWGEREWTLWFLLSSTRRACPP